MNCFPEFIHLAGLNLYGFIANTADAEIRRRRSHVVLRERIHQIAQETDAQNRVRRNDVQQTFKT
jgi:hypothetical protein